MSGSFQLFFKIPGTSLLNMNRQPTPCIFAARENPTAFFATILGLIRNTLYHGSTASREHNLENNLIASCQTLIFVICPNKS